MNRYDPLKAPNPQQWLAAAEQHRINLVEDFHRRERIDLPNAQIHAVVHVIVGFSKKALTGTTRSTRWQWS